MIRPRSIAGAVFAIVLAGCDAVDKPLAHATGYVAHMSCSCVFDSARPLQACLADLPREASWLGPELDRAARTITVRALWVESVAEYAEGRGCKLRG